MVQLFCSKLKGGALATTNVQEYITVLLTDLMKVLLFSSDGGLTSKQPRTTLEKSLRLNV